MSRTSSAIRQGSQSLHGVPPNTRASTAASKIAAQRRITWLYIPALVFMLVMTQIPFLLSVWFSLHTWNLLEPALGFPFVGLANYINEFAADPGFWPVIGHTAELVFGAMALALVAGTI